MKNKQKPEKAFKKGPNRVENLKKYLKGTISINSKGVGYVSVENQKEDIEINFKDLNTALHGDEVEIFLVPRNGRLSGEVTKIIKRVKTGFAGVVEEENGIFFLNPDDTKMYSDLIITRENLNGAKNGEKVFAEIISWKDPHKSPEGKVTKVLGKPGDNNTEMLSIAIERGFTEKLPEEVEKEALKIKNLGIRAEDIKGRRDFRDTLTFTIDPKDAKDFDDAISFREIKDGEYEVGIHIADVSFYVREGTALDEEAEKRGTSVYLVDRTIPMLPEALSNDICSLVPEKDRLTMSAVFVVDKNAKVKESWFGRTVIHSQKRFTYEDAEKSIKDPALPLHKELKILNDIAKKLTKERFENGAISLDQEEVKFVLDENSKPVKVVKKERGDSNRLIEEFMLLANKKVAEVLTKKSGKKEKTTLLYRIHDTPTKEKMSDLAFFLRSLGYKVNLKDGIIPSFEINKILENLSGKPNKDTIHRAVVRSMQKAIYSTRNIGHYGLAFKHYTHFTSPIRRYPDILVHRLLDEYLNKKDNYKKDFESYERLSIKLSEREKKATEAERASIKYKQVEYMSVRIGTILDGVISGINEWGIYVEDMETKSEGMIRVRDMEDDFYIFNEKKLELVGKKTSKKYRFGDKVKVKVKSVDLEKKTIDFVLI